MSNEQWLVYLWSIYPTGGFTYLWCVALCLTLTFIFITWFPYTDVSKDEQKDTTFIKMGKWKVGLPVFFLIMIFLSNLVPQKNHFMMIVVTPYVVDGTKSLIDSLQDPTSKAYKINQLMDKALDKALIELENTITDKSPVAK